MSCESEDDYKIQDIVDACDDFMSSGSFSLRSRKCIFVRDT